MQQPGPQQRDLQPPSLTKPSSHLSWSQPLLPPSQGQPMKDHIPASSQAMSCKSRCP